MAIPLDKRFLSDEDAARLYSLHNIHASPNDYCPTCLKEGFYFWPTKNDRVECDCRQQLQYYKHYLNAGIGALYQRLDWSDYNFPNEELDDLVTSYIANAKQMVARGIGLILMGDIGTGKTLLATLMLKELLKAEYSVFSTTFAGMIDMFTAGWNSNDEKEFFLERVKKSDILLIDDIGKEYKTKNGLGSSTFDAVLRSRVQEGKPTFITTNLTVDDMEEGYGSAILSLLAETSIMHVVEGSDFRQKAGQRKIQEVMNGLTRPIV